MSFSGNPVDRCYDKAVAPVSSMSEEQLKAFLEKVKGDTSLQAKLEATADAEAVIAIAKEAGFMISADALEKIQSELSEEELGVVIGGFDAVEGAGISNNSLIIGNLPTLPIFSRIPGAAIDQQRSK